MHYCILVPDPAFPEPFAWAFHVEAEALRQGGAQVTARPWTRPGDLTPFNLVLPLVAWGYHLDAPRWHALLDRLEREAIPTLNPVPLLRWNSDKSYLAELAAKGLPVVPTRLAEQLDEQSLAAARAEFGDRLVIKPAVSAAADGTHLLLATEQFPEFARGRQMMVQPYLPSVAEEGEYSLMLFGGRFSHAVVKRPKAGDFRVQPHLGGTEEPCPPPEDAVEIAQAALAAAPCEAAYARVDLVRGLDGRLAVIELELIEPSLWLQHASDEGASFAAAIREGARE